MTLKHLKLFQLNFLVVNKNCIADYFGYGMWYYRYKEFPALQLVWTDREGHFPWHKQFDKEFDRRQRNFECRIQTKEIVEIYHNPTGLTD